MIGSSYLVIEQKSRWIGLDWIGLDGLDWMDWMDPTQTDSPIRAPAVLKSPPPTQKSPTLTLDKKEICFANPQEIHA